MTRAPKGLRYPLPSSGGDNWKARAIAAEKEVERLTRETAHLRLIHQKVGCPYGHASAEAGCSLGYPGCACMDDALAMMAWGPEDEDKAAVRLGQRLKAAEAKLAALPPIVAGLRFDLRMQCQFGPDYHQAIKDNLDKLAALSARPPPVPTEEGGELVIAVPRQCDAVTHSTGTSRPFYSRSHGGGRCDRRATYTDGKTFYCAQHAKQPATVMAKATGKLRAGFALIGPKLPTQAPQDVAGLVEGLILEAVNLALAGVKAPGRAQASDVEYYVDRILSALRPSPISHESKGLELAAADAVLSGATEALVLVPREPTEAMIMAAARKLTPDDFGWATASTAQIIRVRYRAMIAAAEDGPVPNGASAAATKEASGQSRQEGK